MKNTCLYPLSYIKSMLIRLRLFPPNAGQPFYDYLIKSGTRLKSIAFHGPYNWGQGTG